MNIHGGSSLLAVATLTPASLTASAFCASKFPFREGVAAERTG
jgi:hypothetical protein